VLRASARSGDSATAAQPGLCFIAGSFAQSRIYSKYLALQIKAIEAGLL
jgi:hypothetical protein